ncbi:MAG: Hsp20/alpha crystallin family protein [Planctomycetaceae bacterium]
MTTSLTPRRPSALTPWFSRGPLASLHEELDDAFRRVWSDWEGETNGGLSRIAAPSMDISETDQNIEIKVDVPGMKANELDIEVRGDIVRISGEHKEEKEEKGRTFHRVERRSGTFERTVQMPCAVNQDDVKAEYQDGVLTVTLAKTEPAKARKIRVKG